MSKKQKNEILQAIQTLPMSVIVADTEFNARKIIDEQEVDRLAKSIKKSGQISPVIVWKQNGTSEYQLVAGFRRFAAFQSLERDRINVQVYQGDEEGAMVINLTENTSRNDLNRWEVADRAKVLRDEHGMTGGVIASNVGKSTSYVNNLLRVVDNVDPTILQSWRDGDGRATTDILNKLAAMADFSEQKEHWDGLRESGAPDGSGAADDSSSPQTQEKIRRATKKHLEGALAAIADSKKGREHKAGAKAALRFALGHVTKIVGVYDSNNPPVDEDAE